MKLNQYQKQAIVRAIFDDVPPIDNEAIKAAIQAAIVKAMSPECKRAYKACPAALRTRSTYDVTDDRGIAQFITGDISSDQFAAIIEPWAEAKRKHSTARTALTQAIESCATVKQLEERMPEFSAYFPKPVAPTPNLPVIANAVQMLTALGWKPPRAAA